jgi:hypothetical protein
MARILRGDIRWADLNPVRGSEQAEMRNGEWRMANGEKTGSHNPLPLEGGLPASGGEGQGGGGDYKVSGLVFISDMILT